MKKTILILMLTAVTTVMFSQVGIGTSNPSSKSILDLTAIDKGLLLPRMTSGQRTSIAPTAVIDKGLHVFDTTTNTVWYWNGSIWVEQGAKNIYDSNGDVSPSSATNRTVNFSNGGSLNFDSNTLIINASNNNVGIGTTPSSNVKFETLGNALFKPNTNNNGTGEPVSIELFGFPSGSADQVVGGLKFRWFNQNPASINLLRGSASNDGTGLTFTIATDPTTEKEAMRITRKGNILINQNVAGLDNTNFVINGSVAHKLVSVTANYTVLDNDYFVVSNSTSATTITLPNPANYTGRSVQIINKGSGIVTITTPISNGIFRAGSSTTSVTISSSNGCFPFLSDGTHWIRLNEI